MNYIIFRFKIVGVQSRTETARISQRTQAMFNKATLFCIHCAVPTLECSSEAKGSPLNPDIFLVEFNKVLHNKAGSRKTILH
jgi:hypothetical protein